MWCTPGNEVRTSSVLALVNGVCKTVPLRAKFVDDLVLLHLFRIDIRDPVPIQYPQQRDLSTLSTECKDRGIEANPIKSELLYPLLPSTRPITLPDLFLCDEPLPVVHSVKLLGVHINSQLTWSTHVDAITSKANRCIFMLIQAKKFHFSTDSVLAVYILYIRTALEYAAPVWHSGLTVAEDTQIERIQRRCLRIILGRDYIDYPTALQRLGIQSLSDRRRDFTLCFARGLLRSPDHRDLLHEGGPAQGDSPRLRVPLGQARYQKSAVPYMVRLLNES